MPSEGAESVISEISQSAVAGSAAKPPKAGEEAAKKGRKSTKPYDLVAAESAMLKLRADAQDLRARADKLDAEAQVIETDSTKERFRISESSRLDLEEKLRAAEARLKVAGL